RLGPPLLAGIVGICIGVYTFKPALEKLQFDRNAQLAEAARKRDDATKPEISRSR
ncbi:hypothetical protein H4R23_006073, partial [Coemansia sp. Cherry 401B]